MGFVVEFIIDWIWVGFMLELRKKYPRRFWTIIAVQLALLVAIFALLFRWAR